MKLNSWFDPVQRDNEFPPMCEPIFAKALDASLILRPDTPGKQRPNRLNYDAFRLVYLALFYYETELKTGNYYHPPFYDKDSFPKFILAVGGSGSGKSRSIWQTLRRSWIECDWVVDYKRCVDLQNEIPSKAKRNENEGDNSLSEWHETAAQADILFLDDLGQLPLQGRVIIEMWNLIDRRYSSSGGHTIITTNCKNGLKLGPRSSTDDDFKLKSMLRRIMGSCVYVNFDSGRAWARYEGTTVEIDLPPPCEFAPDTELSIEIPKAES